MLRLVKSDDGKYRKYEDLLLLREDVRKQAHQIQVDYTRVFGDLLMASFREQIECIKLKKSIAYCQAAVNKGILPNMEDMEKHIASLMTDYTDRLDQMYWDTEAAKNCTWISDETAERIRKIYRRLAKRLHPDINPKTEDSEKLMELWVRIGIAYEANSLEELEALEVLTSRALEQCGEAAVVVEIENIEEKIKGIEKDIEKIMETKPYIFSRILDDENLVLEKKKELREEISEYCAYKNSLAAALQDLLEFAGAQNADRLS